MEKERRETDDGNIKTKRQSDGKSRLETSEQTKLTRPLTVEKAEVLSKEGAQWFRTARFWELGSE